MNHLAHPIAEQFEREHPGFLLRLQSAGATEDRYGWKSDLAQLRAALPDSYLVADEYAPLAVAIPPPAVAIPPEKWPKVIQYLARKAIPSDTGVGDVVQRMAARIGGEVFKQIMAKLGINCGCTDRQKWLNERFPLA